MDKKPSVLFVGSHYWCRHLSELYRETPHLYPYTVGDFAKWVLARRKIFCLVGIGMPDTYKRLIYHVVAYFLDMLLIVRHRTIYWIGSDVRHLTGGSYLVQGCQNVAGSSWLAAEVQAMGYSCREALFPVSLPFNDSLPFPTSRRMKILCYIPDAHHDLHGSAEIRSVAIRLPNIDFTIVGGHGTWWENAPDNVRFVGWTDDMLGYVRNCHVMLRRTAHDSYSAFVREGLIAGRHVIFSYPTPGVYYVQFGEKDALYEQINSLDEKLGKSVLNRNILDEDVRNRLSDLDRQLEILANNL